MITLCLYYFNVFQPILITLLKRGVIVATNKIQTGIRFEPEVLYKITHIAKQNVRSLNAQLEFLAKECIKEFENQNGEIPADEEKIYK